MNEKEIKKLFRQTGDSLQAIFDYFRLKNKVLWNSSTAWTSGAKTITNISKYQTLIAFINLGGAQMIMYRQNNTTFWGSTVIDYPAWFATFACTLTLNGDTATIKNGYWLAHNQNGSHGAVNTTGGVSKIIGLDPILPNNLQQIITPPRLIIEQGGVWHETIHHLKAYYTGYNVYKNKLIRKGKQLLLHYWLCVREEKCRICSMFFNNSRNREISYTWHGGLEYKRFEYDCTRNNEISKSDQCGLGDIRAWTCDNVRGWRRAHMGYGECESSKRKDKFGKLWLFHICLDSKRYVFSNTLSLATRGCVS